MASRERRQELHIYDGRTMKDLTDNVTVTFTLVGGTYESHRDMIYNLMLAADKLPRDDSIEIVDFEVSEY